MVSAVLLQLLLLACLAAVIPASGGYDYHLMIKPQSPVVEIGTDFTATCMIINTTEVVADDLYWNLSKTTISKEKYIKINEKTLNVTISIKNEHPEWLCCLSRKESLHVQLNKGKFIHGIFLKKAYGPRRPENLSCVAVQEHTKISPVISCVWKPVGPQTESVPTTYILNINYSDKAHTASTTKNHANVTLEIFPSHVPMEVWVEARNELRRIESEHLKEDANFFVKTSPPSDVKLFSEKIFPTSLLINWTHPIPKQYLELTYEIRFRQSGSQIWNSVPFSDTNKYIQSFRLQNLQPGTVYDIQVRCKNNKDGQGHWSDWSTSTKKTPEDKPRSKPDVWRILSEGENERQIQFISKAPVLANGKILRYDIMIQDPKVKNGTWENIPVNWSASSPSQGEITALKEIYLANQKSVEVHVTATNSEGKSPAALLIIPDKAHESSSVKDLKVWPHEGQLWVEWKDPSSAEHVVEWGDKDNTDWQRENRSTRHTAIKGNLEKFVCYSVSVYPIYSGWVGKPATVEAFLEEGAPSDGPHVRLNGKPGRNQAELVWEIAQNSRRGFITNYTIFYTSGSKLHNVTVPANITSYTLTSLSLNTKYDVWIRASTIRGSANGSNHSFTTLKYAPGEIEGIVVGVSFGFLFVILMAMLLCLYKKDVIKDNLWPKIPNPGESTIGNWCPDYPVKAETPKENCVPGISVLDVAVCDGKCVFEEDKASLPLKKDKYLSEEHSSGIGGSSCMSSPRQSVSDSDEGGDMADTTASTVQYSSVMASSGYKGQTPSSQPQQAIFSRSESTQPLLDSEENQDMLLQEVNRQSQSFHQQTCFRDTARHEGSTHPAGFNQLEMEPQEMLEPLDFCPLEEESEMTPTDEQSADWQAAAPVSSYMPQLCGYRPQ